MLALLLLGATPDAHAGETLVVGAPCTGNASAADWDSLFQCVGGVWRRSPLFIGTATDACAGTTAGMTQWSGGLLQICDGAQWQQVTTQAVGSSSNVTAMGPPVSASIYTFSSATANYVPVYGAVANIRDGVWPANGSSATLNTGCVSLYGGVLPPNAITFDLGSTKTINKVYYSGGVEAAIALSFSTDGIVYGSGAVVTLSGGAGTIQYAAATLSPGVSARYIKVINNNQAGLITTQAACELAVGP